MNLLWMISIVLQWIVIAGLCLIVVALLRQIGALSLKVTTAGEGTNQDQGDGPPLYSELVRHELPLLDGSRFSFAGKRQGATLAVFFSPGCGGCAGVDEALRTVANSHANDDTAFLLVLPMEREGAMKYLQKNPFPNVAVALHEDFPDYYAPRGTPFALALTPDSIVAARGKGRTAEHLMQMLHAANNAARPRTERGGRRSHEWGEAIPYWNAEQQESAGAAESESASVVTMPVA